MQQTVAHLAAMTSVVVDGDVTVDWLHVGVVEMVYTKPGPHDRIAHQTPRQRRGRAVWPVVRVLESFVVRRYDMPDLEDTACAAGCRFSCAGAQGERVHGIETARQPGLNSEAQTGTPYEGCPAAGATSRRSVPSRRPLQKSRTRSSGSIITGYRPFCRVPLQEIWLTSRTISLGTTALNFREICPIAGDLTA
jgi:hypothetical protein